MRHGDGAILWDVYVIKREREREREKGNSIVEP